MQCTVLHFVVQIGYVQYVYVGLCVYCKVQKNITLNHVGKFNFSRFLIRHDGRSMADLAHEAVR